MTKHKAKLGKSLRLTRWVAQHRRSLLVAAVFLTLLAALSARTLRLQSNMIKLLPEDRPSVRAMHALVEKVGGAGDLIVMIESKDPGAGLSYANRLLPRVRSLAWVESARIGKDTGFFDKYRLLYMELADLQIIEQRVEQRLRYETLSAQPLFINLDDDPPPSIDFSDIEDKYKSEGHRSPYYRNRSGTRLLMVVHPRGTTSDLNFGKKIFAEMHSLLADMPPAATHADIQVELGGTYRNRIEELNTIVTDVTASSIVVAGGILLFLAVYFRHALGALLIMLPLAMSMVWTFGLAALIIGSLNLVTVFLVVVLMGLGIDFGIHMLARYQGERAKGRSTEVAIANMIATAGRSSMVAALTTAVCFFSLLATSFRGFVEFGIIAGTGLLLSALSFFFVLPALLFLSAQAGWMPAQAAPDVAPRILRKKASPSRPAFARCVFALCLLVVGFAIYLGRNAQFEYDMRNLRANHPATRSFNDKVREIFPAARDPAAVLVPERQVAQRVASDLRSRQEAERDSSPIEKVLYLDDLMPKDQEAKRVLMSKLALQIDDVIDLVDDRDKPTLEDLRADLAVPRLTGPGDLPSSLREKFLGQDQGPQQVVYIYQRGSLMDLKLAERFAAAVQDLRVDGTEYLAISEPLIFVDMLAVLRRDTPVALLLSGFALIAVLLIDFHSLRRVLIVCVPLVSGLALMTACMVLLPVRLNLLNAVVLPSILGLGVDGGVHIYHAFLEEGRGNLAKVLRSTGGAVAACALTSMLGFAGLLVADHPGLRSIGLLALCGLAGCLFGAVVVLPSLLASVPRSWT